MSQYLQWDEPLAPDEWTLRNTRAQNIVQKINAGYGTPIRLTLLKIAGAFPSTAKPYKVREPMYKSELAALITKMRIAALIIWLRTLIPTWPVALGFMSVKVQG
jgi:hypothetical protein